jgi:hypothetical protein
MDIDQTRANLKRLCNSNSVIDARLLFSGCGGEHRVFIKLILAPPYSAERETALTLAAREAAGSPTIRAFIDYAAGESSNGQRS